MGARENLAKLPDWVYGVLKTDLSLIIIKNGEMGYYPHPSLRTDEQMQLNMIQTIKNRKMKELEMDQFVFQLNADRGISDVQRECMEIGSQFGWDVPGADIDNWKLSL